MMVEYAGMVPAVTASIKDEEQPVDEFREEVMPALAEKVPVYAFTVFEEKFAALP
jgi:hypothetical protein